MEESWRIVRHCNGLPLALCAIGSSLFGKSRKVWEIALHEMEVVKFKRILQKVSTLLMIIIKRTYSLILLVYLMEWIEIMQLGHLMGSV